MNMVITKEMLESARTKKGGYTAAQKRMGQLKAGKQKGWSKSLIGRPCTDDWWKKFKNAVPKKRRQKEKPVTNAMTVEKDWAWNPKPQDIPEKKELNRKRLTRKQARAASYTDPKEFYKSPEWRLLRVRVLERFQCKCMMCGRSPKEHGIVIHVDHIKPRSKFPELGLDFNNLQILCDDCNIGKSNKYETDWRPLEREADEDLDREHLSNIINIHC